MNRNESENISKDSELIYQEMKRIEKIKGELDSLKPETNPIKEVVAFLVSIAIVISMLNYAELEPEYNSIIILMFFIFTSVQGMVIYESKKNNKRIDFLQKLISCQIDSKIT